MIPIKIHINENIYTNSEKRTIGTPERNSIIQNSLKRQDDRLKKLFKFNQAYTSLNYKNNKAKFIQKDSQNQNQRPNQDILEDINLVNKKQYVLNINSHSIGGDFPLIKT